MKKIGASHLGCDVQVLPKQEISRKPFVVPPQPAPSHTISFLFQAYYHDINQNPTSKTSRMVLASVYTISVAWDIVTWSSLIVTFSRRLFINGRFKCSCCGHRYKTGERSTYGVPVRGKNEGAYHMQDVLYRPQLRHVY